MIAEQNFIFIQLFYCIVFVHVNNAPHTKNWLYSIHTGGTHIVYFFCGETRKNNTDFRFLWPQTILCVFICTMSSCKGKVSFENASVEMQFENCFRKFPMYVFSHLNFHFQPDTHKRTHVSIAWCLQWILKTRRHYCNISFRVFAYIFKPIVHLSTHALFSFT